MKPERQNEAYPFRITKENLKKDIQKLPGLGQKTIDKVCQQFELISLLLITRIQVKEFLEKGAP